MIRYDFTGKVVLVTGSSRGMGAAIVEAFAKAGAVCIVHYVADEAGQNRREADETAARCRAHGATAHVFEADVCKYEAVGRLIRAAVAAAGKIDILVNNAGILRDRSVRKMSLEDWHAVLQTNLDGVFFCSKLAAEVLPDGGRIINTASIAGLFPAHGQANYAAAKSGVIALTKVMAKELGRRRITVNAVAPGLIRTAMIDAIKPEVLAEYEKQIPIGRVGTPADVANAVLFLASEESEYISGQTLPITGGWF
jgi:3-oxoacyl-[acyl-carrier protein] reductase